MEGRVKSPFTELDWSSGRYTCSSRVSSVPTLARWTSSPQTKDKTTEHFWIFKYWKYSFCVKPKTRQRNTFKSSNIGNILVASVVLSSAAMCAILGRTGGDKYLRDVDISVERIKEIRIFGRCWNIFQVFLLPMWVRPLRQLQCETSWGNDYPLLSLYNKVRNHFLDQNQQMWCDYTLRKNL